MEHKELMYYVNDGLNGSLDLFRNETPKPFLLKVHDLYIYIYNIKFYNNIYYKAISIQTIPSQHCDYNYSNTDFLELEL